MKKGDVCEGIIERYDFPNKGSFQVDERKVTIKAPAGTESEIYGNKEEKRYGRGKGAGSLRAESAGGCRADPAIILVRVVDAAYQTMSYDNQLKLKADMVKALLDRVLLAEDSNSKDYEWEGILGSPSQTAYRNKMEFTFGDATRMAH